MCPNCDWEVGETESIYTFFDFDDGVLARLRWTLFVEAKNPHWNGGPTYRLHYRDHSDGRAVCGSRDMSSAFANVFFARWDPRRVVYSGHDCTCAWAIRFVGATPKEFAARHRPAPHCAAPIRRTVLLQ